MAGSAPPAGVVNVMGKILAVVVAVVGALGSVCAVALFGGGSSSVWGSQCRTVGGPLEAVLATIRELESSDRYNLTPGPGGASGAYQYIASTWLVWATRAGIDTTIYPVAWVAPSGVQDQVAAVNVQAILADSGGDVSMVGPVWYLGHLPEPAEWDQVPFPQAGNTLTVREYQTRWLAIFARRNPTGAFPTATTTIAPSTTTVTATVTTAIDPLSATTTTTLAAVCGITRDGWSLPLDGLASERYLRPHHDYPAADLPTLSGSPIHAVHAGTVTRAGGWHGNCYPDTVGCPDVCGIGIVIVDVNPAVEWTYCHLNNTGPPVGVLVAAGDIIGYSGNTGHSSGPHLHLGVRVNGTSACPQPLLYALAAHTATIPDPMSLPTSGCIS